MVMSLQKIDENSKKLNSKTNKHVQKVKNHTILCQTLIEMMAHLSKCGLDLNS